MPWTESPPGDLKRLATYVGSPPSCQRTLDFAIASGNAHFPHASSTSSPSASSVGSVFRRARHSMNPCQHARNTGSPLKLLKNSSHVLGWTPFGAERGLEGSPSSRWGSGDMLGARKAALVCAHGAPRSTFTPLKLPKEGPLGWSNLTEKEATEYTRCISGGVETRLRLLKYGVSTDSYRPPVLNVEIAAEIRRDLGGDIDTRCRLEKYEGLDETAYQTYIMELEVEPEVKVPYERMVHFEKMRQKKIVG